MVALAVWLVAGYVVGAVLGVGMLLLAAVGVTVTGIFELFTQPSPAKLRRTRSRAEVIRYIFEEPPSDSVPTAGRVDREVSRHDPIDARTDWAPASRRP